MVTGIFMFCLTLTYCFVSIQLPTCKDCKITPLMQILFYIHEISAEECRARWKNLRDTFVRCVNKETKPSGSGSNGKKRRDGNF